MSTLEEIRATLAARGAELVLGDGVVWLRLPDGEELGVDDDVAFGFGLTDWLALVDAGDPEPELHGPIAAWRPRVPSRFLPPRERRVAPRRPWRRHGRAERRPRSRATRRRARARAPARPGRDRDAEPDLADNGRAP